MTTRLPSIVRTRVDSAKVTCLWKFVSLPRKFPERDTFCCRRRAVLVTSSISKLYVSRREYSHVDDQGEESESHTRLRLRYLFFNLNNYAVVEAADCQ